MPPDPGPIPPSPTAGARGPALALALGAAGLLMVHHPMILAGMAAIQTDLGDTRLILAILEHTFLWAGQGPTHQDLWSPPFFYPAPNVGAYSDILLTVAPIYWLGRVTGLGPDSALQGWMMAVSALNYGATLALLRRACHFAWPGAAVGSFLVAFGAPRANQLQHQQLMPAFFGVATLFALARLLDEPRPGRWARWAWWQVASWGVVAQLYAGFYNGWFLILGLGVAAAWGLALPGTRGRILGRLGRDVLPMAAALIVGVLALRPFLKHYLAAARELGERDYAFVRLSLLRPWSWLDMGPGHWLAGWTAGAKVFGDDFLGNERHAGLGLVTPAVCAAGWYLGRHRPLVRVAAPAALTLMLLATTLPGDRLADLGLGVVLLVGARLCRDRGRAGPRLAALGLLAVVAVGVRSPSWRGIGLIVFATILALLEAGRARREPARLAGALLLVLSLCARLFDPLVMAIGLGLTAVAVAAVEIVLEPDDRALVRLWGLGAGLIVLGGLAYPDRPEAWGAALLAPVALAAGSSRAWPRAGPGPLVVALGVALAAVVLLEGRDSLWYLVYDHVPGGRAVRAVGRVALALLIPAAVGLAAFFGSPWAARRPIRAGLIGLACLAEQGVTTTTYDKAAERGRIAYLARFVDPAAPAFYYRPVIASAHIYQLDAMMMSLRTGVPTVNGYSGGWPRAWHPLLQADTPGGPTPRAALAEWLKANGMTPDRVQAIGDGLDQRFVPPSLPRSATPPG